MPTEDGYKPGAIKDTIGFQFNPKEVTIAKSAKWELEARTRRPRAHLRWSSRAPTRAS